MVLVLLFYLVVTRTTWTASLFVSQETYHIRLSSITRDNYCTVIVTLNYEKNTDQKIKLLSSTSIDNHATAINFFLDLNFSLNSLLVGLALNRIPQHSQNSLSVKK